MCYEILKEIHYMIRGLTDNSRLRRDGKIRAGFKDDRDIPRNSPHFLLHDAPQLIPVLGEKPTEIYFTFYDDDRMKVASDNLRYYTKSELVCQSDPSGMTDKAAYFGAGDVPYVKQTPAQFASFKANGKHDVIEIPRSRERVCMYRSCPDYQAGKCSEHLFLDMIIPHYSMASLFTLENTSITAVLNIDSAIKKAQLRYAGKLSGQIFKIFKKKDKIKFQDPKTGKKNERDTDVVDMTVVAFDEYMSIYKDKIRQEDLDALMSLRSRQFVFFNTPTLTGMETPQIEAPNATPALAADENTLLKEKANSEILAPIFAEASSVLGIENTEANRIKMIRAKPDIKECADYLKGRIRDKKKELAQTQQPPAPVVAEKTESQPVGPDSVDQGVF
jgi:hypothetical protein